MSSIIMKFVSCNSLTAKDDYSNRKGVTSRPLALWMPPYTMPNWPLPNTSSGLIS